MWTIGSFAFAAPWMLLALAGLPLLWWLLRLTPPAPRRLQFPAIRLLLDLLPREETPHRTPLWLIIFRLVLAGILIIALAHPLINPAGQFQATGPLLLIVDDGWTSAPRWPQRLEATADLIDRAEREDRSVMLLTTAPRGDGQPMAVSGLMTTTQARGVVQALRPQPWAVDRSAALAALDEISPEQPLNVVWISDGTVTREDDPAAGLAERLRALGPVTLVRDGVDDMPLLLLPPPHEPGALEIRLARPAGAAARTVPVRAIADDGRLVARQDVTFSAGSTRTEARIVLPTELRNRIGRLVVEGESSAGATLLFDEGWRRRPVGVIVGSTQGEEQPLLGHTYYVERALGPFNEIRHGEIEALLQGQLAVLVLADIGNLTQAQIDRLDAWVQRGGVLIRFAGTWLAQKSDPLLPVRLRGTDRAMGGAMSWSQPLQLAPFPNAGPFAGLAVPPDVTVRRQVLAEPDIDLGEKTWARLTDGTPLVTGGHHGQGWLVLVHTTANAEWSSLPLSGLFVEMLQRLVELSEGFVESGAEEALPPVESLDGFGRLTVPPPIAVAAPPAVIATGAAEPRHPPGYYGRGTMRRALNISAGITTYATLGSLPTGITEAGFSRSPETDLKPWLLAFVAGMLVVDLLIALALRGLLGFRRTARLAGLTLLLLVPATAGAQDAAVSDADTFAIAATAETRLAYVKTGVPQLDATSRAGLIGLTYVLNDRTAIESGTPIGVDIESDELAFFPILYWPIAPEQAALSDHAIGRINGYLRNGGTILFDTLDQSSGRSGAGYDGPGIRRLRDLARGLDIPPLIMVPPDHVLTKSFYLLQHFPGRWADGAVWVENSDEHVNDGVSSVIVGGNDWASAWAVDNDGRPMFAVVPGGEHQRETAYRFGVNLVMYALTGNYKSDQVHVPFILERLGQ